MNRLNLYLAGPITGLTYQKATAWRQDIRNRLKLKTAGWNPISPLDGWEFIESQHEGPIPAFFEDEQEQDGAAKAVRDDLAKIDMSRAVLLNLHGAKYPSIGSMAEMGYAFARTLPIVTIVRDDEVHWHPFVTNLSYTVVDSFDQAVLALARLHADMTGVPYA